MVEVQYLLLGDMFDIFGGRYIAPNIEHIITVISSNNGGGWLVE